MLTFITLPNDFASSTLGVAGGLISDLSPYLTLILGVLLTVTIVAVLIRVLLH
jgi:hypothetical protein